jgi:hypothetical protein
VSKAECDVCVVCLQELLREFHHIGPPITDLDCGDGFTKLLRFTPPGDKCMPYYNFSLGRSREANLLNDAMRSGCGPAATTMTRNSLQRWALGV